MRVGLGLALGLGLGVRLGAGLQVRVGLGGAARLTWTCESRWKICLEVSPAAPLYAPPGAVGGLSGLSAHRPDSP